MIMSLQIKDADNFAMRFTFWSVMSLAYHVLVFPFMKLCRLNLALWFGWCFVVGFCSSLQIQKTLFFFIPSLIYLQKRHWSIGINKKLKEVCSLKSLEVLHYPCNGEMDQEAK